ncbi:MAG: peptidase C39 family protein [Gammaproteobacteria bacterium]|nr:peptidase C39 family protein [Gammaproteobacteria bacterium]
MIRDASLDDLDALVRIENACFETDRLSRRNFRYMLTRAHASLQVDAHGDQLRAYVLTLFHAGTSLARLYSVAVLPAFQGQGIGARLIEAAETTALEHECIAMRLEVREDNPASISLYERLGYHRIGNHPDYYEDHMAALRMEKRLVPTLAQSMVQVPYYRQTLDFTCGPASLMMAMKALHKDVVLDREEEIRLWRESTTVFMTSGHGGCGPYGMALAAFHRGFNVEVYVNDEGALFVDSVRSEEKKEVIRLVQADFLRELRDSSVQLHFHALDIESIHTAFDEGAIPVVLISSYRIYHEKFPHWVVITGFDERYVYVHDPYVDEEKGKTATDVINMPILKKDFQRMARYGKSGLRAVLLLREKSEE